jgi:large subunit ribosomal protein L28
VSMQCDICGKKPILGNKVTRRGKAKYLGGVGRKITGISRRKFMPNLQNIRTVKDGTVRRLRVCTQCIRSGRVQKPVKNKPFQTPA